MWGSRTAALRGHLLAAAALLYAAGCGRVDYSPLGRTQPDGAVAEAGLDAASPDASRGDAAALDGSVSFDGAVRDGAMDASVDGAVADGSADGGPDAGCTSAGDCDDGNPCTTDTCEPTGTCSHMAMASGTLVPPVSAFDASPMAGDTCGLMNVLATDGMVAGLDYGTAHGSIDGQFETGCVGVDFGGAISVPVIIDASSTGDACGYACTTCGTGDDMDLFEGTTLGTYTFVVSDAITSTLTPYTLTLAGSARYVVVCRRTFGSGRDDVAVDSILAQCP